ncbi:TonB-dependent receptor domain-containing protein [Chitinophaga sp. S165]|uniref:TonB-dependent receptor domain-containing protein n=1 Tax=Chitinophaga sp. S165 TaxID=2135462 RepID=UPI000D7133BE|nr:TonB-dependent receptor [Chitinophaga sp. S165]PWV56869.1 TonB-dependent receptor-like protein [Chitinophaga sp. S165]
MTRALLILLLIIFSFPALAQMNDTSKIALREVVVAGEKLAMQRRGDKMVVNISGNRLLATAANAIDILRKLPGIEVNGDGTIQMSGRITPSIFIDGKPVPMSAEELQNYLASLPPNTIESIELINNPSSRYDGEHKGIIDIRLKKDQTLGWQGNAAINMQQHAYNQTESSLSLSYKTKKVAYSTRLGYVRGKTIRTYEALQHLANTNIQATNTRTVTGNNNINLQFGVEYNLKKDQLLGLTVRTYQQDQDIYSFNTLHTRDKTAENLLSEIHSHNNFGPKQHTYAFNLNYTLKVRKTLLEVFGSVVKINNRQHEDIRNIHAFTDELWQHWNTALKNDILIRMAQADFTRNISKGKLGAGAKFAFTSTRNDLRYDTLTTEKGFVLDSSRTNNFQYDEYISAAYISYENTLNKISYNISLRTEHTHSKANAVTQSQVTKRDYLKWLPSFSLTYAINTGQQVLLSYSRRMTRPNFSQLNPFRFYFSPLNYWVGNPYLLPSTTDMLSLAYTRGPFNVNLFAGRESDPMTRYPEYDSVTNILQYLGKNLPHNDFAGIEISFPLTVTPWWKMNHNIRGAYKKELMPYHEVNYEIPIYDYTVSGSQVFTLPREITFDISYYYRSLSGNGLYVWRPVGNVDLSLRKNWLNGKLNTRINYYDIFNTYRIKFIFREKQIIDNELQHWFGIQRVAFSVNYSFGRSTHKGKQQRKNEEENRAGM